MKQVEDIIRKIVKPEDLSTIVSNIGVFPDLSALFTPNSGMHTATVDVGLKEDHRVSSFVYMSEVREQVAKQLPQLRTYFQSGGLVDAVLNQGMPAPIDVQVSGMDLKLVIQVATNNFHHRSGWSILGFRFTAAPATGYKNCEKSCGNKQSRAKTFFIFFHFVNRRYWKVHMFGDFLELDSMFHNVSISFATVKSLE